VVVSVCLGGECMTEVKSHPNLLRFYNSNGTRRILTLQLAAWPALDTCDRILKSIVQWRKRCSKFGSVAHKKLPGSEIGHTRHAVAEPKHAGVLHTPHCPIPHELEVSEHAIAPMMALWITCEKGSCVMDLQFMFYSMLP
jgi:hypothetical protein